MEPDIDDKEVWDIDRERAFLAPERIRLVTDYILTHFDQKTYRGSKTYTFSVLQNIADVASASGRAAIEEIKQKQRVSGFNSILRFPPLSRQSCIMRSFSARWRKHRSGGSRLR